MNILLIGTGIPTENMKGIGGAGIATIKIAETLAMTNRVYIIPRWSERPTFIKKNIVINGVEYVRRKISFKLIFLLIKYFLTGSFYTTTKYAHNIGKIQYALIYLFDRAHAELVLNYQNIDVIHIHGLALYYLPYIDAAIEKKIPIVCTSHGLNSLNSDIKLDYEKSYEGFILKRLSGISSSIITTVSTGVKDLCIQNFGIPHDKIRVIHNGADHNKFGCLKKNRNNLRELYSLSNNKILLLQVGTLTKRKNHIAVLRAIVEMEFAIKEKILYLIIGGGDERNDLSNFVKENYLEKYVKFMGIIPDEELVDIYCLSDLFVLPSTSEGLPLVFLEAMAAGLPIITMKDLQGVMDVFNPDCMELIPNRDVRSLIDGIIKAIERDWDREKIMEYGKSWNWEKISMDYSYIYKNMTNNKEDFI